MLPVPPARTLTLGSLAHTRSLGERLALAAQPGDIILLSGDLGAGKTALTQAIARGLGIAATVNSPTFTLLKEHGEGRLPLYHFDLYRLDDPEELWSLGFEEYFTGNGLCVVEWAERAPAAWTSDWLWGELAATGPTQRRLALAMHGARGQALLQAAAD